MTLWLKDHYNYDEITSYLQFTLGKCATGSQYVITGFTSSDCSYVDGQRACSQWTLDVKTWRYCGNGGRVSLNRKDICISFVCTDIEKLDLRCYKSVECVGTCEMDQCVD